MRQRGVSQWLLASALATGLVAGMGTGPAQAQVSDDVIRIGILNDQSGPYADFGGLGSVEAAKMAAEELGGSILGKKIEIVAADHRNSKEQGAAIAKEWFESGKVDAVADLTNSGVALAVQELARQNRKVALFSGPATADLTGKACSPTGIHWAFDTYSQAVGAGRALVKESKDTWYIITADYAFGHAMEAAITKVVTESGGKVIGTQRHPLNAEDFSKLLMDAQASPAKVVALASAGNDTVNAIKQAALLGIGEGTQSLVGLVLVLSDIHNIGLDDARGLTFITGFYWDRDPDSRAFAKAYEQRMRRMPGMIQASVYSSVRHYLKAVEAAGTDEAMAVVAKMKAMPVNDAFAKNGVIRDDGRMVHDMYLVKVKAPRDSKGPWDYYTIIRTVPGNEAFRPLAESECPLAKK